jgi:hypothetical protein
MPRNASTGSSGSRKSQIDQEEEYAATYGAMLEEAISAYRKDPSYGIAMARSAVTIQSKRKLWAARTELKSAETAAHQACSADPDPFVCDVTGPCGTGRCPYASFELSRLDLPSRPGPRSRPRKSLYPLYDLEAATRPWIELREE